jgi:hypothetical protein
MTVMDLQIDDVGARLARDGLRSSPKPETTIYQV